jgi:hypothetical protein
MVDAPGKEYERIVAAVHRDFAGPTDRVEEDVHSVAVGYPVLIIIECKDYRRRVEVGKVDEVVGKREAVNAALAVLVSNSGCTDGAIQRANQDGRIQLSSMVDVEDQKLRSRIKFGVRVETLSPGYSADILSNTPVEPTAAEVRRLAQHFEQQWNNHRLPGTVGHHEYWLREEQFEQGAAAVRFSYDVTRQVKSGMVPLRSGAGIYPANTGQFSTKHFGVEVNLAGAEDWTTISEEDNRPVFLSLHVVILFDELPDEE